MPSPRATYAIFTSFKEEVLQRARDGSILSMVDPTLQYAGGQIERCPNTHELHLHLFIQLKTKGTKSTFQRIGGDPLNGSNKRKLMDAFNEDPQTMMIEDPAKFRRCVGISQNLMFLDGEIPEIHGHWQSNLRHRLTDAPDFRTIFWIYGAEGNEGKTLFAKKLAQEGWFVSPGGKVQDLLYLYTEDPTRHVCFDIPRSHEEYVNYACIEEIKNRRIQSTKYEPVTINMLDPVHVVIMANFRPRMSPEYNDRGQIVKAQALSEDRVVIICCKHGARSCRECI
nr:Rep [Pittosporum tobira alphasatellite 2]